MASDRNKLTGTGGNALVSPGQAAVNQMLARVVGPDGNLTPEAMDYASNMAGFVGSMKEVGPIRAYHGSPNDFDKFDLSRAGSTTDSGDLGRGLYFSTDPAVAASKTHKYEVGLNVSNPLELQFPNWSAKKPALVREALGLPGTATSEEVAAEIARRGHDSVRLDYSPVGYNHQELAVFDPSMIDVLRKYGLAGVLGGSTAAAAGSGE